MLCLISRRSALCGGLLLLLAGHPASAQAAALDDIPKFSKEMRVVGPKDITVSRTNIFEPNADCEDARVELVLVNGEVAIVLREIQNNPFGTFRGRMGDGKMRYVIGKGVCRIVISVEPEISTTPNDK